MDQRRKRRVGVREEVGRARGRRELPEEGRGEWGVALGLRVREHGPPFAEATKGQEVVIQASRYTGAEVRRGSLFACCAHVVAGRAVARSAADDIKLSREKG